MSKKPEPLKPTYWDIYKAASKGKVLGAVEAADAIREGCCRIQGDRQQAHRGPAMMLILRTGGA